ncbi:type II secretion system inner membrane protein GspF [Vibrio aestuarianus]|uniref:type II secretion system inner membrane protein GspF n=1 Tax=Vibrio aestuarianus TaxID=28171 RepID=UPI00144783C1|nr:type II secretion system inner membrane protein GspF [Vibrio aestuarianus]MDE1214083.1 type II secretion system inner membrane protein GspF [Vibrio aestuarianus]MDE1218088.1 type II secretion system inner membrane protein GspF [Vibrio aestuarianus]MDE1261007.1 type II secretion system inner membrane protein GspF [Vibrio aestuarianus]MDE1267966.1 type II secretion system inner membrane protein GspF [Vibrio aestuarianus]MDE1275357.1 type II secretion system inner membrane protein GspF [Vibrio
MGAFEYKALDAKGKQKKGVIEGDNARQVRQRLKEQGLIPVEVLGTKAKAAKQEQSPFSMKRGISTPDLALITRQLSTLVQSGMPLEECLKAVSEQSEKPRIRNMLAAVRSKVTEGYTLSDSLGDYPHIFDELFRSMVAAGEKSGHLDSVLERLADYAENRQKMRSKLMQAMIYPIVLVVFAVGIVAFLLAAVVPKIIGQFVQMGQELPKSTQFLLSSSDFIQHWGIQLLVLTIALVFLAKWLLSKPNLRLKWDRKVIYMPMIGKISRGLNTSRFARTLSICTSSAIPILEGMKVAVDVMANQYVKQQVTMAADNVREGASLCKALDQTKLFPPMMLHMIASGEQSGELESMLTRAADNQDANFESTINIALGIFTPALIALMAGLVLFIVMATLMPILEMNNLMSR